MPVALAPSSVAPSPSGYGGYGTLAGSLTGSPQIAQASGAPATYMGVPFNSLPAGNQAAILAAQQQGATSASGVPQAGQAGAGASPGKVDDPSGFSVPPMNDVVNAGLTAGGFAAPMGAGFLGSVVKGLYQQFAMGGDEANTNNMSLIDRAAYGPGFGEQFVSWLASLFGDGGTSADGPGGYGTPGAETTSSIGQPGPGNFAGAGVGGVSLPSTTSGSFGDGFGLSGGDIGDVGEQQASKGGF